MNKDLIFDAMEYIGDEMLEEVDALRCRRTEKPLRTWSRALAGAACLCVVMGSLLWYARYAGAQPKNESFNEGISGEHDTQGVMGDHADKRPGSYGDMTGPSGEQDGDTGVTVPEINLPSIGAESSDMVSLFVWAGRVYSFCQTVAGHPELVGSYLGTVDGTIDEWTNADGYVDFSGTVSGDFYTVSGYDPSFMLCMKGRDGAITLFVNNGGITLRTGYDLFEHRLHLSGNYKSVKYFAAGKHYDSGQNVVKTLYSTSRFWTAGVVRRLVNALNDGEFLYADNVLQSDGSSCLYRLLFCMEDGTTVYLRLYEGGYVQYEAIWSVCVKIDAAVFDELLACLA